MAGVKSLKLSSPEIILLFKEYVLTKHDDDLKCKEVENREDYRKMKVRVYLRGKVK